MTLRTNLDTIRSNRPLSLIITIVLLVIVTAVDYTTGPAINLAIAYFLPITFAAWSIGRAGTIPTALVAEVETYIEQMQLVDLGQQSFQAAVSTIIVRLLIYLFVAEVTIRLVKSVDEARRAAARLRDVNEELQSTYTRLDEDVKAGGLLQSSAMEFVTPAVPGCEVGATVMYAQSVGGDLADAGMVDGSVWACVADISGKGTPAALFTILIKHLMSTVHRLGYRGREAIAALNSDLCNALPSDRFVTLFYVQVDPVSGYSEYINAGHPEGLIYRSSSGKIEFACPTSPLLGFGHDSSEIKSSTLTLDPGDVMILYTDGATESRMKNGGRLGDDVITELVRRRGHLTAQEMADSISREILDITEEGGRDDLAIVCIKKTEL